MMKTLLLLSRSLALLTPLLLGLAAPRARAQGHRLQFNEEYALAQDRAKVLGQLIPGTPDYYYYSCLERQGAGDFGSTKKLLSVWRERHEHDARIKLIENRQALLTYSEDPAATFAYLKHELRLGFNHLRNLGDEARHLPSELDPSRLDRSRLIASAIARHPRDLDGFRDSALLYLAGTQLNDVKLRILLTRLQWPDAPGLARLVVRDLKNDRSRGFGSLGIHTRLLLSQLEECADLAPKLLQDANFVSTYIKRLLPSDDIDWHASSLEREAYLDRLQRFVDRLSSAHNSLKAHVLYQRLAHDLALGKPSQSLFLDYLRLPRSAPYYSEDYLRRSGMRKFEVHFGESFGTGFPVVVNDEALVRSYLSSFFKDAGSYSAFGEFIKDDYLRRLFAETKILAGEGDMERWYSLLDDPGYYELLKERVEIEFSPTQPRYYARDADVVLDVQLKNVGTLLIKIFEINTFNYYRDQKREVDASIDLDGLVAGSERSIEVSNSPLRRVPGRIELPELKGPGVYVVELIGNGLSSRAVIQKGKLQLRERNSAAGHILTVLDEEGKQLREAKVWFSGREYVADDSGQILIPFGTSPGLAEVLLLAGKQTERARFQHAAESYALEAGIFVNREALVEGGSAQVVVHPNLSLNGRSISLKVLEDVVLSITSIDQDGLPTHLEIPGFELSVVRDSIQKIQVASGLAQLQVELRATVQSLSTGKPVELRSARVDFHLNTIDAGLQTDAPMLGRNDQGYVLDVLGKNGEPKAARRVNFLLRLHDFSDPLGIQLETDAQGRIKLGELPGVDSIAVSGFPEQREWSLLGDRRSWRPRVHGMVGDVLRIPYQGLTSIPTRAEFALFETRAGSFAFDRYDNLTLEGGYLELRGLAAGDYLLHLRASGESISIAIGTGEQRGASLTGRDRHLELAPPELALTKLGIEDGELVVHLANAGAGAALHVLSTRYVPAYDPYAPFFARNRAPLSENWVRHSESDYHSGREISDEYRYILERRYAQHLPGNMLTRPGLILNPWALDETHSVIGSGGGSGGRFGGKRQESAQSPKARRDSAGRTGAGAGAPGTFPNLDFLPHATGMKLNLRPNAEGIVRIPLADLGSGAQLHVIAVDSNSQVYRTIARPEQALALRDRRLAPGLDSARHLAQQRSIDFYSQGQTVVVEDASNAKLRVYDSLSAVYQLYSTLSGNPELTKFDFILGWPELKDAEKRALYSEHACHELHFFLHEKDPTFFGAVVKPYLENKAHKTFLDEWFLERDLSRYLEAHFYAQLNTLERILLSRRIAGQLESGQRHLRELLELTTPDPISLARLFDIALRSGSLEESEGLGLMLGEAKELAKAEFRAAGDAIPPAASRAVSDLDGLGYTGGEDAMEESERDNAQVASEFFLGRASKDDADLAKRGKARPLYRAPDPTRPYIESNYWHLTPAQTGPNLIGPNAFWMDYALSDAAMPFGSSHFIQASGSFAEMMFALSVLDLPFQAGEQKPVLDGSRLSMQVSGPLIVVSEQIKPSADADAALPVLVSQSFFRVDDRYRYEGNQRLDKPVTREFLQGVAYGIQVVVTNPTSTPRQLELLLQIPEGALPLQRGFKTRGSNLRLQPYGTQTVDYHFYFPASGQFSHYPVHVSRTGQRIASAEAQALNVVPKPTIVDVSSWAHVSQNGSDQEVFAFIDGANLLRLNTSLVAWRMQDKGFYGTLISKLRARHHYDEVLWSYGIKHKDPSVTREYLSNLPRFVGACGSYLDSALLSIDPVERKRYQLMEFAPLVNPRAHRFGAQREILDLGFARQYESLLDVLAFRPRLDAHDWMTITYYLLLQDRVPEAQTSFARVQRDQLQTGIQFDYMRAYMDFFTPEHSEARAIAAAYASHPVDRWRKLFQEVIAQLDEAEGKTSGVSDAKDLGQQQTALASAEPAIEMELLGKRLTLEHQNLEQVTLNYYEMDIEFLFSTSPFVQQGSGSFAYVRPNRSDVLRLDAGKNETSIEVPAEFAKSNVLVELRAAGMVRRQAQYANSLSLGVFENYGQIKVSQKETGAPLSAVYIKVFAKGPDGQVRFHKDGYTDLRGRFDYASLTGASDQPVERFAILVLSENDGASIREVAPPQR